ncbi:histidine--tRNA ligase [Cytophaga hutchinsonii]|jgi:histidyl-tRNA synthetase|uniref:Histidine--tRNA ligase n=1 Tax=Cytophaga hutchinsonii (strain ATCC 33406 / DSM 1761 / CIP 103989 / NBRC 15051 / NCIMB 9469 / D465) TaxID=269798 RepID=SYH_CYTH3|nr:histidine--tRNA ligase [Cytophaga hutchinsonii]Q11RN9.1 RecName: Full=Histidine--tRNA ligase; AltName: Full=Histidyl-tRNA synthetase; Short=HisRS [Cytophaga hutchinsonii ATCC 33406]ABG59925.1 histidyl-tRNA synthetase [Cytophaga hutchinsonii ATCC 33406]SFX27288.1 histidyl-tRNA synthetase [Cytophaga hutchinsonii ATCC 33406]
MEKPSLPKGTRDFGPAQMLKRQYLLQTIREIFTKYGFLPIETPAMENLSVLTGKYGDEGDQLIYKILNSGDFIQGVEQNHLQEGYKKLIPKISKKALRYDLTVPFARHVVMNRNDITFPFKRYQIQPVWRADRPQKGRYCEFMQCDADVVGTDSLLCEAEIVLMIHEAFAALGITDFVVKINNRKILSGIADAIGKEGSEAELCVAIDKLDKIGKEAVLEELKTKGFTDSQLTRLLPVFDLKGNNAEIFPLLRTILAQSSVGLKGIDELEKVFTLIEKSGLGNASIETDLTLARGLSYYTGAIFEVKILNVQMGSVCGGGRYDNLTGVFGLPNVSGVGISFGIDRIYDVMNELNLFPSQESNSTRLLICAFDENTFMHALPMVTKLRAQGINTELYPDPVKIKKQLSYADDKKIPFALLIGEDEMNQGLYSLKNLISGEQFKVTFDEVVHKLI